MRNHVRCFVAVAGALAAAVFSGFGCAPRKDSVEAAPSKPLSKAGFHEAAAAAGIRFRTQFLEGEQGKNFKANLYDHGSGLAVADYDGDGRDDVYFVNQLGPNALYRNRGDGTFEDVTKAAGVGVGDRVCVCATWADFDNDADPDLFVTSTRGGNLLFRNDKGAFVDVTEEAGVDYVGHSQTGAFLDYDNDGKLDLFVANTADWTVENFVSNGRYFEGKGSSTLGGIGGSDPEPNLLYHNEGDGRFSDVTKAAGVGGKGWSADVVVLDYDEDGYQDLLVTRMFGPAQLFRNVEGSSFKDVTMRVLGKTPWGGMGARIFDYDQDGRLDIGIVDMHSDMWMGTDGDHRFAKAMKDVEVKRQTQVSGPLLDISPIDGERVEDYLVKSFDVQYREVVLGNALYRNLGKGRYQDVTEAARFETMWPWGCAAADFDCDGDEDVFMAAGMGYPFIYWPNYLLMNDGHGRFENKSQEFGVEPPPGGEKLGEIEGKPQVRSSRCAVTADFDQDGRVDLMVNNFHDAPYYFQNRFPTRKYIAFRLIGTRCNRDAIGAVLRLVTPAGTQIRQVQSVAGYLSQSSNVLHFGLGDGEEVQSAEILWPSGDRQKLRTPAPNKIHTVTQAPAEK